jgi:hypothetical protein
VTAEQVAGEAVDERVVRELAAWARAEGLRMTGEGGLLSRLTKRVFESALEGELDDHLGYGKHDPAGRDGGNSRNGTRAKTVLTEVGPVELEVPRDRDGSFTPQLVKKRQRRLSGVDELVISLSAKGVDPRRDLRAPGRDLRRAGVQAGHQHDHRSGDGRDGRLAEPTVGQRVSGDLH